MLHPKISICLPCLNTRPFLKERIDSIYAQTFEDWEVIVVDSYSDDGSWEYMQERFKADDRVKLYQAPRDGIYQNWNRCIEYSSGEYIYFATSDDTFYPECLSRAYDALELHPGVSLCDFNIHVIDEAGAILAEEWKNYNNVRVYGDWIDQDHIRSGNADLMMMPAVGTIFTSMTGLLIRKRLFDEVGMFPTCYGSIGDYAWQLQALAHTDVIHLGEYLATWRVHGNQATNQSFLQKMRLQGQVCTEYAPDCGTRFSSSLAQLKVSILRRQSATKAHFFIELMKTPVRFAWFMGELIQGRNPLRSLEWALATFKRADIRALCDDSIATGS